MMQHKVDGDGACLILFAGNMILSAASNAIHTLGFMTILQGLALAASIVASIYVSVDHHLKIKWKKNPDKKSNWGEHQKHNDSGGHN